MIESRLIWLVLALALCVQGEFRGRRNINYQGEEYLNDGEDNEIPRVKRDVLKGLEGEVIRTKRYIGRVPLAYMKKGTFPDEGQPYYANDQDQELYYGQQGDERNEVSAPVKSHFRDFENKGLLHIPRSNNRPTFRQGSSSQHELTNKLMRDSLLTNELGGLSDEEIERLLLLVDGQEMVGGSNRNKKSTLKCDETESESPVVRSNQQSGGGRRWTPEQIQAIMDMYIRPRMGMGKRETGKRSVPRTFETYEQPMSFDNAMYSDGDQVEFVGDKRVGTRDLIAKTTASNRVKKETDPAVLATLSQVFNQGKQSQKNLENAPIMESSPSSGNNEHKVKKDIDWSNYLGVDKRGGPQETTSGGNNGEEKVKSSAISSPLAKSKSHFGSSGAAPAPVSKGKVSKEAVQKAEQKKENEVTSKDDDRDWILEQFYKNLAMSTNVKKKRESPSKPASDLDKLEDLEKKMADAGDKIIWDALKYTGSHRDETLTPEELAQVKSNIISKLSTAYSLEKVREAVDDLREQLALMEKKAH